MNKNEIPETVQVHQDTWEQIMREKNTSGLVSQPGHEIAV
jgi:hypothetical protein